jgi:hypothetical protein
VLVPVAMRDQRSQNVENGRVLVITDAVTGRAAEIGTPKGGLLRIVICLGAALPSRQLGDVRALLAADVLKRSAEFSKAQVLLGVAVADPDEARKRDVPKAMDRYGMHPPEVIGDQAEVLGVLGGVPDLWVVGAGAEPPQSGESPRMAIGPVSRMEPTAGPAEASGDPLEVRLALLSHPFHEPLELSARESADARTTLLSWRRHVAVWAEAPSKPLLTEAVRHAASEACVDADVAELLRVLHQVQADPAVPDGAKFETFCGVDRILGLGIPALVGRSAG